jgi:hypothetical protein
VAAVDEFVRKRVGMPLLPSYARVAFPTMCMVIGVAMLAQNALTGHAAEQPVHRHEARRRLLRGWRVLVESVRSLPMAAPLHGIAAGGPRTG